MKANFSSDPDDDSPGTRALYERSTDVIAVENGVIETHHEDDCTAPCPIHAPTEHKLSRAPQWWNGELRIMERLCSHNEHHPDPDDIRVEWQNSARQHACDGCCDIRPLKSRR